MAVVNASGAVQDSYTYDVYGKPTKTGSLANEFDFAGQQTDGTELQYLRARYYDPASGTFLSRDPMASQTKWLGHPTLYTGGSPVRFGDPTGQFLVEEGPGVSSCTHIVCGTVTQPPKTGPTIDWRSLLDSVEDAGQAAAGLAALVGEYLASHQQYCAPDGSLCTTQEEREAFAEALKQCAADTTCAYAVGSGIGITLAGVSIAIAVITAPVGVPLGVSIVITLSFAGIELSWGTFAWYEQH